MLYLLDTDVIIDYLKGRAKLSDNILNNAFISVITYAELEYGFKKADLDTGLLEDFLRNHNIQILDLNKKIVSTYVDIRLALEKGGTKLADFDILIAATAIVNNLKLVTRNLKHFGRIKYLSLYKDDKKL